VDEIGLGPTGSCGFDRRQPPSCLLLCFSGVFGQGTSVVWNWNGGGRENKALIIQVILTSIYGFCVAFLPLGLPMVTLLSLMHLFCWKPTIYKPAEGAPRVDHTGLGPMASCGCDRQRAPDCGLKLFTGICGCGLYTVCSWDGPQLTGAVLFQVFLHVLNYAATWAPLLCGVVVQLPWACIPSALSTLHLLCCWNPKLYEPTAEPPQVVVGAPVAAVGTSGAPPVAANGTPEPTAPLPAGMPAAPVPPAMLPLMMVPAVPAGAPALPTPPLPVPLNYGAMGA